MKTRQLTGCRRWTDSSRPGWAVVPWGLKRRLFGSCCGSIKPNTTPCRSVRQTALLYRSTDSAIPLSPQAQTCFWGLSSLSLSLSIYANSYAYTYMDICPHISLYLYIDRRACTSYMYPCTHMIASMTGFTSAHKQVKNHA